MRKLIMLVAVLLIAGPAGAKTMQWHGTTILKLGAFDYMILDPGSGVATVNSSSGGAHLSTLRIGPHLTPDSGVWPVTDPESTAQVKSIIVTGFLGTGTLVRTTTGTPTPGVSVSGTLPMGGYTRVCLFIGACAFNIHMNNTYNGTRGVGVAGTVTMGGNGSIRISVSGAPWTLATVTQVNQTKQGNYETISRAGWVHGGASATSASSTAVTSGVINFVQAASVKTEGITGNSQRMNLFIDFRVHFIPEPGLLLLLGSGVVGLGLLGRSRLRK